jgi:hypothetical protein
MSKVWKETLQMTALGVGVSIMFKGGGRAHRGLIHSQGRSGRVDERRW